VSNGVSGEASQRLYEEVLRRGLCTMCGACVGLCPYFRINPIRGSVKRIDICDRDEGRCYQYCPRTATNMDVLYQRAFGVSYDESNMGLGVVRDIFLARSKDPDILSKAQDGGAVTTLLWAAMEEGMIDAAIETKMSDDRSPSGFVARNKEELLQCAGNSYETGAALQTLNRIPRDSIEKLTVVGLPCQVTAVSKMKAYPSEVGINIENIKLVIGLFCGWSLSSGSFHRFLQDKLDLSQVVKFDIPHHPGHTFDVYTNTGKVSFELEEIRKFINPACSYCCDMTSQFADISVGSGRARFKGWNTVIVRTDMGIELIKRARKRDILETQPIPPDSVNNLREAALNKMRRALKNITMLTGSEQDLGYLNANLEIRNMLLKKLLEQ